MSTQTEETDGPPLGAVTAVDISAVPADFQVDEEENGLIVGQEGEELNEYGATSSSKKHIPTRLLLSSTLIVLLSVLVAAIGHRVYKRYRIDKEGVPLKVDDVERNALVQSLKNEVATLESNWLLARDRVRQAFILNYFPSQRDDSKVLEDPLANYKKLAKAAIDGDPKKTKTEDVVTLKLLEFVCRAAARRLSDLRSLDLLHTYTKVGVPILGLRDTMKQPSDAAKDVTCSFVDFLRSLESYNVDTQHLVIPDERVPRGLADQLLFYFDVAYEAIKSTQTVARDFDALLKSIGLQDGLKDEDLKVMEPLFTPSDPMFFDFSAFSHYLSSSLATGQAFTKTLLQTIANNWSSNGIRSQFPRLAKENAGMLLLGRSRRRREAALAKKGAPVSEHEHLYSLAVFLI